jgi:hypothetical protein
LKLSQTLLRDLLELNGILPSCSDNDIMSDSVHSNFGCVYIGLYKGAVQAEIIILQSLLMIQMYLGVECDIEIVRVRELFQVIEYMEKTSSIFDPIVCNAAAA